MHAPERVTRLVLESASPGIEDDRERTRRIESDAALAQRILGSGIEAFVAEWERVPLLAPAPHVSEIIRAQHTAQRLRNNRLGLANSLRGMGAGQQTPLWPRLPDLKQRVLLMAGERDARYCHIAERMHGSLPASSLAHALYTALQQPNPTAVRYPRGAGTGVATVKQMAAIPLGKGEIRRETSQPAGKLRFISESIVLGVGSKTSIRRL